MVVVVSSIRMLGTITVRFKLTPYEHALKLDLSNIRRSLLSGSFITAKWRLLL